MPAQPPIERCWNRGTDLAQLEHDGYYPERALAPRTCFPELNDVEDFAKWPIKDARDTPPAHCGEPVTRTTSVHPHRARGTWTTNPNGTRNPEPDRISIDQFMNVELRNPGCSRGTCRNRRS